MKIQDTNAYKALDKTAALIATKANSRNRIMRAVAVAKTIGYEKWKTLNDLPKNWYLIVKELAET